MSEFPSREGEMSSLVSEASDLLKVVAGPQRSVKKSIRDAADRLGFKFNRAKDIWYGDTPRIDAYEMDRLRHEAARAQHELAVSNLLALRARLTEASADFHKPTIEHLERALVSMGVSLAAVGSEG